MYEQLAQKGQAPKALVIACIDSRVDPARIFDAAPGEILALRNVANLVPPYQPDSAYHGTSAALEFAVCVLRVPHIVVMGHGLCAGVRALLEGAPIDAPEFVGPWMTIARPALAAAVAAAPEQRQLVCEQECIKVSLQNLLTFPWIEQRVAAKTLRIHGAWFDIHSGVLQVMQPGGEFQPVATPLQ